MINDNHYNRPSIDYGVSYSHCNIKDDAFWNYVSNYQNGPEYLKIDYRRPVNASTIYRGDCSGDNHSCNSVKYTVTDANGNIEHYRSNEFESSSKVGIEGTRIRSITMKGDITGRGVDRMSGPIIACPI